MESLLINVSMYQFKFALDTKNLKYNCKKNGFIKYFLFVLMNTLKQLLYLFCKKKKNDFTMFY